MCHVIYYMYIELLFIWGGERGDPRAESNIINLAEFDWGGGMDWGAATTLGKQKGINTLSGKKRTMSFLHK